MNKHYCKCGCNTIIEYKPHYKWRGFPNYIRGHYARVDNYFSSHKFLGSDNHATKIEVRKKMSETALHMTTEHKAKNSKALLQLWETVAFRASHSGENHPCWQGGISFEDYPQYFTSLLKESIRKRDGHVCSICLTPEYKLKRKLDVHHIDYNKKNCASGNLIALCRSCHTRTTVNRERWQFVFASQ